MSPRFTIVTCTRNSVSTLPETIRSVQEQDFSDFEHLFVDGKSTDGTLEYLRSLTGRVRIIEGVTGGISRAMNIGIREAAGQVVAHLHSDDYYAARHVLGRVSMALDESRARWIFGRCLTDIGGQRIPEGYRVPRYSYPRLLKGNFIPHPATFVEKSLFEECGAFEESIKYAMDYDLWLRLARIAAPLQLDEYLAVFRVHAGSLSSSNRFAAFEDDWSVRKRYIPGTPWALAYHWAHYLVRRRRAKARALGEGMNA